MEKPVVGTADTMTLTAPPFVLAFMATAVMILLSTTEGDGEGAVAELLKYSTAQMMSGVVRAVYGDGGEELRKEFGPALLAAASKGWEIGQPWIEEFNEAHGSGIEDEEEEERLVKGVAEDLLPMPR